MDKVLCGEKLALSEYEFITFASGIKIYRGPDGDMAVGLSMHKMVLAIRKLSQLGDQGLVTLQVSKFTQVSTTAGDMVRAYFH